MAIMAPTPALTPVAFTRAEPHTRAPRIAVLGTLAQHMLAQRTPVEHMLAEAAMLPAAGTLVVEGTLVVVTARVAGLRLRLG